MRLTCSPFEPASATRQMHLWGLPDRRMHRLRCYTQPTAPIRPRRPDARRGDRLQPQHAPRGAQDPTTHCERPSTGVLTERLRTFDTRVRLSGVAIGAQIGFALAGFAPAMTSAVRGTGPNAWLALALLTFVVRVVASVAAWTARETHTVPMHDLGKVALRPSVTAVI